MVQGPYDEGFEKLRAALANNIGAGGKWVPASPLATISSAILLGGKASGVRLLKPETVESAACDRLFRPGKCRTVSCRS